MTGLRSAQQIATSEGMKRLWRRRKREAMIRTEKQAKSRGGRGVKRKGSAYELEVMDQINAAGLQCNRTVGSGSRNHGGDLEVRIPVHPTGGIATTETFELECKRWGSRGGFILDEMRSCDALVFRNDRGKSHIVIGLDLFLDLLK